MNDVDVGAEGEWLSPEIQRLRAENKRLRAEYRRLRAEYKWLRRREKRADRLMREAAQRMLAGASEAELEGYIQRALRILEPVEAWEAPEGKRE